MLLREIADVPATLPDGSTKSPESGSATASDGRTEHQLGLPGCEQRFAGAERFVQHSLDGPSGASVDDDRSEQVGGGLVDAIADRHDDEQQRIVGVVQSQPRRRFVIDFGGVIGKEHLWIGEQELGVALDAA